VAKLRSVASLCGERKQCTSVLRTALTGADADEMRGAVFEIDVLGQAGERVLAHPQPGEHVRKGLGCGLTSLSDHEGGV
jgi:hypothetical protein